VLLARGSLQAPDQAQTRPRPSCCCRAQEAGAGAAPAPTPGISSTRRGRPPAAPILGDSGSLAPLLLPFLAASPAAGQRLVTRPACAASVDVPRLPPHPVQRLHVAVVRGPVLPSPPAAAQAHQPFRKSKMPAQIGPTLPAAATRCRPGAVQARHQSSPRLTLCSRPGSGGGSGGGGHGLGRLHLAGQGLLVAGDLRRGRPVRRGRPLPVRAQGGVLALAAGARLGAAGGGGGGGGVLVEARQVLRRGAAGGG
jgi:hypothetical protein